MSIQASPKSYDTSANDLFVTFEEFPRDLYREAHSLGFDLRALEAAGMSGRHPDRYLAADLSAQAA